MDAECIFSETYPITGKQNAPGIGINLHQMEFYSYSTSPQHLITHGRHLQLSVLLAANIILNYITAGLRMH